jgi:hypothetical protein
MARHVIDDSHLTAGEAADAVEARLRQGALIV